jgi:hypothetical protein
MKILLLLAVCPLLLLSSCTMLTAWKTIPAPGGCEDCHKVPISANWQVSIRSVTLTDERNVEAFQTPESVLPKVDSPAAKMEKQKVEELACFECHNSPNPAHRSVKGKFHH